MRKKKKKKPPRKKPLPPAEDTTQIRPLKSGGVSGPFGVEHSFAGWIKVLHDEHRRSFLSHRKQAFTVKTLKEWWNLLSTKIKWRRPATLEDRVLPRSAAWLTSDSCTCTYEYGGIRFPPLSMDPWLLDITDRVCRACGLKERPNALNANFYDSGEQTVGWHSDNEPLFDATNQDALIVSLSLGATRSFELRSKDNPFETATVKLEDGDLCTMEGLCQKHYRHRVPPEPQEKGPRINLTWRWIVKHSLSCRHSR